MSRFGRILGRSETPNEGLKIEIDGTEQKQITKTTSTANKINLPKISEEEMAKKTANTQTAIRDVLGRLGKKIPTTKGELMQGAKDTKDFVVDGAKRAREGSLEAKGDLADYLRRKFKEEQVDEITKGEILKALALSGFQPEIALAKLAKDHAGDAFRVLSSIIKEKSSVTINSEDIPVIYDTAKQAAEHPLVKRLGKPVAKKAAERLIGNKKKK